MKEEIMPGDAVDDAKSVWKNQSVEPVMVSLAELRKKAKKFERRVFWRNLREYAASVIVIACFGFYIWKFQDPLARFGSVLVIAGVLFVVFTLHKRGAARSLPVELTFRDCLEFHRKELERQRDLLLSVWTWYLLPLVPGLAVFLLGIYEWQMKRPSGPAHAHFIMIKFAFTAVVCPVVFIGIGLLNQWAARKLQRKIDALNGLEKEF
jgi:hypothetical protein